MSLEHTFESLLQSVPTWSAFDYYTPTIIISTVVIYFIYSFIVATIALNTSDSGPMYFIEKTVERIIKVICVVMKWLSIPKNKHTLLITILVTIIIPVSIITGTVYYITTNICPVEQSKAEYRDKLKDYEFYKNKVQTDGYTAALEHYRTNKLK